MKLNPKQAPLYGECVLTVQLGDEECVEEEEDVEFYLLFSGSTQRHLTTTLRIGHVTLQAVCPAHDRDEAVRVTLCQVGPGGSVDPVAEERFQFVQDLAVDMAHFLVSAAMHRGGLEGALLLTDTHINVEECERLDHALMLALKHLPVPPGWSVLGPDLNTHSSADFSPHETLLHFAARRGLRTVALFLLQQPGGRDALRLVNKQGHTPARVAQSRGHTQLQHLLSELEKAPHLERKAHTRSSPAGRWFQQHSRLNTFSLTVENTEHGEPADLQRDVDDLRHYAHTHTRRKTEPRQPLRSFPLILSRDLVCESQPSAVSLPEDASDHKLPAREQEVDVGAKTESIEWPNGGLRSEECKVPASGDSSGSGTGRVGLEVAGVCVEKRENSAAVSTVSCGEQQKEEVDNELKLIREPPETTAATNNKIQSGNRQEDAMGQTPGLLPERGERNASSGDLPEEREGERKSEQETFSSRNTPTLHGQTHGEKHSPFNLNVDVNVAENTNEIQETGSSRTRNPDTREGFRSNMAPGPVHNVRLHSSSEVQQLHDVNAGDQIDAPSGITSDPPPCDDVTDVMMSPGPPDRLLPDVSPTADQISLPEMKESSSPLSEPGVSTERSEETSQIISRSHCGGEELSQKHDDSRSDLRNVHIVDVMHQESDRSQSPLQVLEITLTSPSKYLSDSIPQEERSGHTSKLEKESQTFQTLPESPCEFFCIDGFSNKTSLELPVVSQETTEEGVKVETELLEMCESSKRSPVTVLCGSFSKLTIRGSPLGPQLDHMTSNTIERAAEPAHDDLETSITFSSEAEETKEEVIKLEPEFGETCERTETCEEPPTVSVSEENLKGTAAVSCSGGSEAQIERPPESQDIQEAWIYMKISTQLVETPEVSLLPCESLLSSSSSTMLMASVLKNITDPQLEFMTFEEENNKTSTPTQSVLLSSTETTLETSPCPKLEVSDFKENIREPPEVMTLEESNTGRSPDLHHDLITSSEGTTGKTSVEIFSEVKLFEDQQLKVMTSEESTSVELIEDVSHVSLGDVTNCEEVQQHEKSTNASLDFKHELMNFEESNKRTHEFHPGLITTSEESIRETFCGLLPEVSSSEENIRDQQPEVMNSEESMRGTSFGLAHDLNLSSEETCSEVSSTEENVLDQSSKHGTSQQLEVATSENSFQNTHREVAIGETSPEQEPEITVFEGSVGYSPDHTQLEETTCEENLRTSVDPSPEFLRTNMDTHVSEVETVIPESFSDSRLALENVSTSEPLEIPDQPVELDIGAGVDLADCPPVGVDSGLIQDLASSDGVGVHDGGNLEEVESHTEEEHGEELAAGNAVHTDNIKEQISQSHEIHREEDKVLYSLHSDDLQETCSKEFTETDVVVASVCHAVSATSLPRSESVSDGDSTNDTAFIQNEDTLTLTSGISMTRSVSTDDSSITHAVIEPEEEEKKDRLSEFLERSAVLCSVSRSHAPSRRHSWEPSKDQTGETSRRSVVHAEDEEKRTGHRRSMSWCPSHVPRPEMEEINTRSYSLEGLADEGEVKMPNVQHSTHSSMTEREERGSLASLTEEENENNAGDNSSQRSVQDRGCGFVPPPYTLTKSVSMSAISPRDLDSIGRARPKRRISFSFSVSPRLPKPKPLFAFGSSSSDDEEAVNLASGAVGLAEYSISEEDPAPLKSDSEVRATKVSRTFSYLKSKMTKKSKEKDRDRNKDGKEKEKKSSNGHLFNASLTPPPSPCVQCNRPISMKDAVTCTDCSVHVHKGCRDAVPMCAKVKMKQQTVTDSIPAVGAFARGKSASARERPWSTFLLPEDQTPLPVPPPRKTPGVMAFNSGALSKSISISNIAGQSDEAPLKALKILSQSSESLSKTGKVNESTESLTDEGAELVDTNLMVEFEADVKQLEADSWSFTVDKKYLKQLKKDVIKRQDVIYELIQTELHHVRILRIMAEVYSKGLQKEVQVEVQTLEMMFPVLEELMELHTHFLTHLLERRREARDEKTGGEGFIISRIGDVLLDQVTGSNGEKMKKVYGKFCSRHNEAVNIYKEFYTRDKRFQAFIKKKMSSAVVRRLSIPECILLVTQRITKYPVLLQRLLQHTREPQEEQDVSEALRQMKEVLMAVDGKVNEFEKRTKLKEIHSRTDSKSIMRMKSGQMFAREDLIRGRKLLHDGPLQLKNAAGRLKDVHALLLSDVFVFLQEKDQKYVFASLDQRSTVISLQKLIIREVANEERGLFFITAGIEKPEMVEVHASSKDERNTWMQLIQNTTTSIDKDDDEGIPSENEEDKRLQESKAKEMKDQLQKKDEQIVTLLEEKVRVFRELCECVNRDEAALRNKMLFRATGDDVTKGEPLLRDALREVEILQELVSSSVVGQQVCVEQENSSVCAGSVSLPRRAETFGGFDCHQMNISKNGDREEADDLRRTESDSVLKKGVTANLLLLHKRNSEQLLLSVTRVHDLLNTLQAVVVQQDTFIEEQRQALISPSLRHPSVSSSSSSSSSWCSLRPNSLMEQEKQRQDEKIREEQRRRREEDDRKRREEEEERRRREEDLDVREERLVIMEEETRRRRDELQHEQQELKTRKEEYQRQLLTLRDGQRRLERDRQLLHSQQHNIEPDSEEVRPRSSSTASDDSVKFLSSDVSEGLEVFSRADSKRKAKNMNMNMNPFGQKSGTGESQAQIPNRFLQLAKARDKKEKKKKKKGKGDQQTRTTDPVGAAAPESSVNKDIFFC